MIRRLIVPALLCLFLVAADKPADEGFVSIFNGKDLAGWEGEPGWWSVVDGCITVESTKDKPCKRPSYLFYKTEKYRDFELKCSYRIIGGNSGINFRSLELPNWDVKGYQADIEAGPSYTGILYECNQRAIMSLRGQKTVYDSAGKKTVTPFAKAADLQKFVKPNDWNEYHIIAKGPEIILKINGEVMTQVIDNDPKAIPEGFFTLQVHPGPPMKAQYKDIRVKKLNP